VGRRSGRGNGYVRGTSCSYVRDTPLPSDRVSCGRLERTVAYVTNLSSSHVRVALSLCAECHTFVSVQYAVSHTEPSTGIE